MTDTWITIATAATLAGRSRRTIYNWVKDGRLRVQHDDSNVVTVRADRVLAVEAQVKRGRPVGSAATR